MTRDARIDESCPLDGVAIPQPDQVAIEVMRVRDGCVVIETELVPEATAGEALDRILADPSVVTAAPREEVFADQADPDSQWHLDTEHLDVAAFDRMWKPGRETIVAVLDTGVDASHPDLDEGRTLPGIGGTELDDPSYDPDELSSWGDGRADTDGHGTHVAGIIAAEANNGRAGRGLAPDVRILPVTAIGKRCDAANNCSLQVASVGVGYGVVYAASRGADVVNLSLSSGTIHSPTTEAAIRAVTNRGVTVVASAGNCGERAPDSGCAGATNRIQYPAAYENVVAVAAVDQAKRRAAFSTANATVDIAAPGASIVSAAPTSGGTVETFTTGGTSQASPQVAATAALLHNNWPEATPALVEQALKEGADKSVNGGSDRTDEFGEGLLWPVGAGSKMAALTDRGAAESPPEVVAPALDTDTVLSLDTSSSMSEAMGTKTKMDAAMLSAGGLVTVVEAQSTYAQGERLPESHRVGVVRFATDASAIVGLTDQMSAVRRAIDSMRPSGETNLGAGLQAAIDELSSSNTQSKSIVVLSDGMTNQGLSGAQILASVVPDAANAGIVVHTVGFGEAGNYDEELLREIAAQTGGTYSKADVTLALQKAFLEARASTLGTVELSQLGFVSQSEVTAAGVFDVGEGLGTLEVTLAWPGSDLDVVLRDPDGNVVEDDYGGAQIFRTNPEVVIVDEPMDGDWTLDVRGVDVPGPEEEFAVVAATRGVASPDTSSGVPVAFLVAGAILLVASGGATLSVVSVRRRHRELDTACSSCGDHPPAGARICDQCGNPMAGQLTLRVVEGPMSGAIFAVGRHQVIGRGDGAHHQLLDETVSRMHAAVAWESGCWVLRDLGSASGTYRNDERVSEARVAHGDVLTLGDSVLVVEESVAAGHVG